MRLLTILLFGCSLTAQVSPTAPGSLFTAGALLPPAANAIMEPSPRTVEPHDTAARGRTLYLWSVATLAASGAADVASSCRPEANALLAGPGSTFGGGSVAIKLGLVGSSILLERLVLRHRPDLYRRVAWLNFGIAGAQAAVVRHNLSLR
jgi:hypothetical protein